MYFTSYTYQGCWHGMEGKSRHLPLPPGFLEKIEIENILIIKMKNILKNYSSVFNTWQ
jgi:hypothetical protein